MATLHIKSKNKEILWESLQDILEQYGQAFDLNFEHISLVIGRLSDIFQAKKEILELLKDVHVKLIDQECTQEDQAKLEEIAEKYQIHFSFQKEQSSFIWKILGTAFIGFVFIQIFMTPKRRHSNVSRYSCRGK